MRFRILRTIVLVVTVASFLAACSNEESSGQATWYERNTLYSYDGNHGNLWDRMREDMHMPTYTSQPRVREQIRWYQNHQAYLNHIIAESAPYIYYIYQQTQKRHLPAELALIPVIESEYNPYAKSRVGAIGLWQMEPSTARGFGLKRDWWYDGSKDVVASTNAALEYFTYLHSFFNNNWPLAIAAYDCGEGRVMACARYNEYHHRSGDFWDLPLPYETQAYVPRLLAVAAIVKHPSYYGIHLAPINDQPYVEQINVGSPIQLSKAAKMADVPLTTMKVLNPGIQHDKIDPKGPYTILVPEDKAETFKEKLAALTTNEKLIWQKHIVKSKETLEKIAENYHTTIAMLKEVNGLKSNKVHANQTLLIPPANSKDNNNSSTDNTALASNNNTDSSNNNNIDNNNGNKSADSNVNSSNTTATENSSTDSSNQTADNSNNTSTQLYTVKAGDQLWKIAEKNHISTKQLRQWNHLSRHHILKEGEKLVVSDPSAATSAIASTDSNDTNNNTTNTTANNTDSNNKNNDSQTQSMAITYEVKNGDDLNKIARKFHITVNQLKEANQLTDNTIKVGQIINIPTSGSKTDIAKTDTATTATANNDVADSDKKVVYVVRHGDYLEKIAKKFNVTMSDIKKWNPDANDDTLQPGQKLVIHSQA